MKTAPYRWPGRSLACAGQVLRSVLAVFLFWSGVPWGLPAATTTGTAVLDAPDFELKTDNAGAFRLSAHKGSVRVLLFVRDGGRFVPNALDVIEKIMESAPEYAQNTRLVCLATTGGMRSRFFQQFEAQSRVRWTQLEDRDGQVHRRYNIIAVPTVVLVDRKGRLARKLAGYTHAFGAEFRDALRHCLALPDLHSSAEMTSASRRAARHVSMADLMVQRRIWPSALRSYRTALEIDPGIHRARLGAGFCLLRMQNVEDAEKEFQILKKADGLTSHVRVGLAWAMALRGDEKRAADTLERMESSIATLPEYFEAWAAVYDTRGDRDKADEARDQADRLRAVRRPAATRNRLRYDSEKE